MDGRGHAVHHGVPRRLPLPGSSPAKSYGYAFNSALVLTNTTAPEHPDTVPMVFDSSITSRNAVSAYALPNPARHVSGVTAYLDGHVSP